MSDKDPAGTPAYADTIADQPTHDTEVNARTAETLPMEYHEAVPVAGGSPQSASPPPPAEPEAASRLKVHDKTEIVRERGQRSSTELAEPSRKERKRERDKRAENAAVKTALMIFVGLGVLVFFVLNNVLDDAPPAPPPAVAQDGTEPAAPPQKVKDIREQRPPGVLSTSGDELPDLPAIRSMTTEGLTVATEGLPQILAVNPATPNQTWVGLETCRFAYGIWEFSPNNAFRFMTTCPALRGQTLVGAYEIDRGVVRMSPLNAGPTTIVSSFAVERPSKMTTAVKLGAAQLNVRQRVTIMRPGMDADGFRKSLGPKNKIQVQGLEVPAPAPAPRPGAAPGLSPGAPQAPPEAAPPEAPPAEGSDPVLDLLQE